jgi:nitrate reductase gamma subunit
MEIIMNRIYLLLTGPVMWACFIVFIFGIIYQVSRLYSLAKKREATMFSYISLQYSLRSIIHWVTPFASHNMRRQPVKTVLGFLFHICLILTPVFLPAHIMLIDEAFDISYLGLPWMLPDVMAVLVIIGTLFFMARRILKPEVRYVTTVSDYLLLFAVAAPFFTGLWLVYHLPGYDYVFILHILSGQVMLVIIPFTRLSHIFLGLFSRAYTGSEFGGVRFARDW